MKSPFIADLEPNQIIHGTFLVQHKDVRQKKSGDLFLLVMLADRTGELDARMFDNAAEAIPTFERDSFVKVKGLLQIFQNRQQLTIHKIQPVPDSDVDFADFFPCSTRNRDEMFQELLTWIAMVKNPHLKALLDAMFSDPIIAMGFRTAPAAKSVHHAWLGGLIEHVLSMCHLAKFTAAHYRDIDLDLLLTGVLLHDIGKIRELTYARGFGYSTEGQLLGHITIGIQMVDEKLRAIPDFPANLRDLVFHLILSHHGEVEFGSPKVPMFAEAMLLHQIDNMDSKMELMRGIVERDLLVEGVWSAYNHSLERTVLKKQKFLANQTAPAVTDGVPAAPAKVTPPQKVTPPANSHPDSSSAFASKLKQALTE